MNKSESKNSTKYLAHLINKIESKRQLSINEMNKSCLATTNQLCEINAWYQNIIKCIKRSPPDNYVSYLTLYQDTEGIIYKVEYAYTPQKEKDFLNDIEFVIILWNDTE